VHRKIDLPDWVVMWNIAALHGAAGTKNVML
jgi:hypothetical protein